MALRDSSTGATPRLELRVEQTLTADRQTDANDPLRAFDTLAFLFLAAAISEFVKRSNHCPVAGVVAQRIEIGIIFRP
jgi:hypothetical protein